MGLNSSIDKVHRTVESGNELNSNNELIESNFKNSELNVDESVLTHFIQQIARNVECEKKSFALKKEDIINDKTLKLETI